MPSSTLKVARFPPRLCTAQQRPRLSFLSLQKVSDQRWAGCFPPDPAEAPSFADLATGDVFNQQQKPVGQASAQPRALFPGAGHWLLSTVPHPHAFILEEGDGQAWGSGEPLSAWVAGTFSEVWGWPQQAQEWSSPKATRHRPCSDRAPADLPWAPVARACASPGRG